ncbi:dipeptide ABC transporter ATP-binding protein [Paracoccus sp. S-4012]|uniref:dipeptide ABC transporter ATP-binding protein n=1 Tax=Paracoccus sp. S-4012 TaxID=2665648 RepID=UPI0012B090E4|nr:ABC transporter ATP-binding protein [Paracoccus sp. S-4012]MRX50461.1 dipeptide ABC transporter ATP-binding protein [Paracoccus sp. S-4012]
MSDGAPVLEFRDLTVALPPGSDRPLALDGLTLQVRAGEIVCLVGESGSGKSLAALAAMRLLAPGVQVAGGTIRLDGRDLAPLSEAEMRGLRGDDMAMIFQEPMTALNPQKRVGWQIDEVLRLHTDLDRRARRARIREILEEVRIPDPAGAAQAYPHQLSGGQRQRVMIAMALVLRPRLIIADEPTTALDVTTQKQVLALIRDIQRGEGAGILFITHDFGVVAEIADRVAVLRRGELVEQGPAAEVLNRPQHPYTRALIAAVPALIPPPPAAIPPDAPVVLKAEGLDKTFSARGTLFGPRRKPVQAVRDLSFELRRGETLGVVGESGSGKTTVARIVTRLIQPDSGRVLIGGEDFAHAKPAEVRALRRHIQMVFQDPMASLNPRKRVIDLIAQGPMIHGMKKAEAHARARSLLELVELSPAAGERYPHEFSGGQRQRIGIARALALEPRVIVADEPVSALDVSVQAQVLRLLADLRARLQLSLLFVTHDLRVAAQLCDRVMVMSKGEVVETGPTAEVFSDPQHPYTQSLIASIPGRDWTPPRVALETEGAP